LSAVTPGTLLERVSDSAAAGTSHMHFLGVALLRLDTQMTRVGELLAALKAYTPVGMRAEVFEAGQGLYNACEEVADATGAVVGDYVECLLLAQACATGSPLLKGNSDG
jgi:hypothetical protein